MFIRNLHFEIVILYFLKEAASETRTHLQVVPQLTTPDQAVDTQPPNECCPRSTSRKYDVVWPPTSNKTISQPPCVNQAKELVYRECCDCVWGPEPQCDYVQSEVPSACPEGFKEIEDICYKFSSKSPFPPVCPSQDVVHFNDIIDVLKTEVTEPVWLPVTRDLSNGFEFLRWVEHNSYYKTEYVNKTQYTGNIKGKDCLVYDHNGMVTVVSCTEEHVGICAYTKLILKNNKVCDSEICHQSGYFSKTTCFCLETEGPMAAMAEFLQPYQNGIFLPQEDTQYAFGLKKSTNGTYIWKSSGKEISYTYWSSNTIFDAKHIYGVVTPTGWILTEEVVPSHLTLKNVPEEVVKLELFFKADSNNFLLSVTNPSWLETASAQILCFTNAQSDVLLYIYPSSDLMLTHNSSSRHSYEFVLVNPYSGHYWCEAFQFSNLKLIQTEKALYSSGHWDFVVIFQMKITSSIIPLSLEILTYINEKLLSTDLGIITVNETDYNARIMKIVDLDEDKSFIVVNIHYTSSLKLYRERERHFHKLKSLIETAAIQNTYVEMLTFSSSDFCASQTVVYSEDLTLTWPATSANEKTTPEEFCFQSDGTLVTNECNGDFINGYQWTDAFIECTILKKSSVSNTLLPLYYEENSIVDEDVGPILQMDVQDFAALDVYLLVKIYEKYFTSMDVVLDTFRHIIAQVLTVNGNVLSESQLIARSTDKFLYLVDNAVKKMQKSVEIIESDFVILLTSGVCCVTVQFQGGDKVVKTIEDSWSIERLVDEVDNLELAIWLSPDLRNELDNQTTIDISIYFSDKLFMQSDFFRRNISKVFGLHIWENNALPGPISIVQKVDANSIASCLYWVYEIDYIPGLWVDDGSAYNMGSYRICDFKRSAHYAFDVRFRSDNVSDELADLLNPSIQDEEKLSKLANISEKYEEFRDRDVFLVAQVLDQVKNNSQNNLHNLATTVDNLHKIDRFMLSQSQKKHKATDLILHNIDSIIRNYQTNKSEILITTENFLIFVSNNDLSGLMLMESNQTLQTQVLRGDLSVADIEAFDNFSSSVLLSSDLKLQLEEDSKVIITAFFSDVLFNEKQNLSKGVSTIFGVILPEIGNYSGPISILHNISASTYSMECVYWNYSINTQTDSYWKKDSDVSNYSSISQCEFWHTTHFGLLLNNDKYLDDDPMYWVTIINSSVSLAGVLFIIMTAVLFEQWRRNLGNQILLNFSVSIAVQIVTFFTAGIHSSETSCMISGALLHYFTISEFCWTLTIAFLQFKRFVKVFAYDISYTLLKACIIGWILPIIPVVVAFILDDKSYVKAGHGLCYPTGSTLFVVVWLPLGAISIINFVVFIFIAYSIINTKVECAGADDTKYYWRLFVLLFFMLGLTWSFGFMARLAFGIIFEYMFNSLATLQGFVLFLYFIVFNHSTRRLYVDRIKRFWNRKYL